VARDLWNEPLEILAAHGHGRSYGAPWTRVLARKLPGILPSQLWQDLAADPPGKTCALMTDIGNDILYEFPVADIAGWVEQCLDRLCAAQADGIVATLPVDNLHGLSEARYKFFRNLFMPGCSLGLSDVMRRAQALNRSVEALATARGMHVVTPRGAWYGLDPIHIRQRLYRSAWQEVLGKWREQKNSSISRLKLTESLYVRTRFPQQVKWFGRHFCAPQPSVRLADGTTIALY